MSSSSLLPAHWNPQAAADAVMQSLVTVTAPQVKGAHDAELALVDDYAYVVAEVSDLQSGESPSRPEIYVSLSIVHLPTLNVEAVIPVARSEQKFANATLPFGQCFVPRIIAKDPNTLRCYFASQYPGHRQAQIWHIDFDIPSRTFDNNIYKTKLKTAAGILDMQPQHFHADAARLGLTHPLQDHGLYLFDSFKTFDGHTYVALNNFPGKQNALARANADLDTFEIMGHYFQPQQNCLSESAVNRLPDGSWLAICRQDHGDNNYLFTASLDGKTWSPAAPRPFVPNGTNSKPTFDRFNDIYYLGWQEATTINGVPRSVFNLDVSRDARHWHRKYRFQTDRTFQYPAFRQHNRAIYLTVTQGNPAVGGKVRILFGKLENL